MDFKPDPALEAFRAEVRAFLDHRLPDDLRGAPRSVSSPGPMIRRWQGILNAHGWGAPGWAKEHGGAGWSVEQQLAFDEECVLAGAPAQDGFAHKLLGPVLNHFGTQEQQDAHRPAILSGARLWCQGFSEPGAGSDLASLRTRAERDGRDFVINGQKTWSSYAHRADWMFVLARTDPAAKKQAGISFFLVDMKTPGVRVRPIVSIDGAHHLNETFFDDVRVPEESIVGGEGMGWTVTKFLLNNEHATAAELPMLKLYMRRILTLVGETATIDAGLAPRIAAFGAELAALEMMVARAAAMHGEQSPFAHALGSMLKLRGTELQQRMTSLLVEVLGDDGAVAYPAWTEEGHALAGLPRESQASGIAAEMFFRRAATIYGGASEVQRGIVAKLLFGF